MRVYVIRHGESETNLNKVWTGWTNAALTDKGRIDAKNAGKFLKQCSFEKIFASDLCRATETAEIAIPGCKYETSELLREINVGTLANKPLSILTDKQKENISQFGYVEFQGESRAEFLDRISLFMKKLESFDCENIAIFTHNGWMRSLLDVVIGTTLPRKHICCNNCAIAIFEVTDVWKLHSWINL